jgi:DNA primase
MSARLDLDAIKQAHSLPDVAAAAGLKLLRAGSEYRACCPFHADRSPSFTIYKGGTRWCCFAGCGEGDVLDFIAKLHHVGLREAAGLLSGANLPSVHVEPLPADNLPDRTEEARTIWRGAQPARGTLAEHYLRSRGLTLPIPESIRFKRLHYGKRGHEHPCLIAAVASPDNRLCGIQRTYLNADGTGKLDVEKPKLSLGRVKGGAIRLSPAARSMIVCEGLEDGLTLMQELGRTVWVGAGAGFLSAMQFPFGTEAVAIGGDADEPGRREARKAADAFAARGIKARTFFPIEAKDFNAELMERAVP